MLRIGTLLLEGVLLATAVASLAGATSLKPGFIIDPPGLQWRLSAAFNSHRGFYAIAYGGSPYGCGVTALAPNGSVLYNAIVVPNTGHGTVACHLDYSPPHDQFLLCFDKPITRGSLVLCRYLGGDAKTLVGPAPETIIFDAEAMQVAYNPVNDSFLVVGGHGNAWAASATLRGAAPIGNTSMVLASEAYLVKPGMSTHTACRYNTSAGTAEWLAVYSVSHANGHGGGDKGDIWGRRVSVAHVPGAPFGLVVQPFRQQTPRVAYWPATDEFYVAWEDWALEHVGDKGNVRFAFWHGGNLSRSAPEQWIHRSPVWTVPSAVGVQPRTGLLWQCQFAGSASTCYGVSPRARGLVPGAAVLVSTDKCDVQAAVAGPGRQMLFVWKQGYNGVYAGLYTVPANNSIRGGDSGDLPAPLRPPTL